MPRTFRPPICVFVIICILVSLLDSVDSHGADVWPTFRGPHGNGIAQGDSNPPIRWSPTNNVAWRTELPGEGWSSPVVDKGRIYLTAAIPRDGDGKVSDYDLSLLVVDAINGTLLKTVAVMKQDGSSTPRIHAKNSHASPTPILDGNRIFAHFGYQGTACLTRDGDVIWINRDLFFKPTHGNGGTPVLVDGKLVFTCDGGKEPKVVALNADTGSLAWQTRRPIKAKKTFSFCTPTVIQVGGEKQIVAPGSDCVLALDPDSGEVLWDVRYEGYSVIPKPVYDAGLVFVATSFDKSKLLAIDPGGNGLVTDSHVRWQVDRNMPKTPSLIASDGLIYSISDNGIAICIDAADSNIRYQKRVGGNFSASPILVADRLYFTSEQGITTVVRAGPEYDVLAENDLSERTLASLAVTGNALIIRTADALYRIEEE